MIKHPIKMVLLCGMLISPVAVYAEGFDYNDIAPVPPDYFKANEHAAGIIGQRAVTRQGDDVGDVVDVVFDDSNKVRGYIVDVGGFFGIDATPLYIPGTVAKVRIDGVAADLVIDMLAADLKEDAKLD